MARQAGWPEAKLENEKPQGETVNYDELVKRWQQNERPNRRQSCYTLPASPPGQTVLVASRAAACWPSNPDTECSDRALEGKDGDGA
jgi:hypothetical protein